MSSVLAGPIGLLLLGLLLILAVWSSVLIPALARQEDRAPGSLAGLIIGVGLCGSAVQSFLIVLQNGRPDYSTRAGLSALLNPQVSATVRVVALSVEASMLALSVLSFRRSARRTPHSLLRLLVLALLYWSSVAVSTLLAGGTLGLAALIVPFVFAGIWNSACGGSQPVYTMLRRSILTTLYLSLAIWMIRPDLVLMGERRLLNGLLPYRMAGVFDHPNTLGAISAVGLVVVVATSTGRARITNVVACGTTLIASESITSWAAALSGLMVLNIARKTSKSTVVKVTRALTLPLLAVGVVCLLLFASGQFSDTGLSGRTTLWSYALSLWRAHPLLGNGTDVWRDLRLVESGLPWFAGQAHNQVLETLVVGGLLGCICFLLWLGTMGFVALAKARRGTALPLALLVLVVVRSVAETPFDIWSGTAVLLSSLILLATVSAPVVGQRTDLRETEVAAAR